ncbi:hypothetical protein F4801DRAFT_411124 [Xylaria longipes]|nr:hypothetical protein F4801DRAFT_411124 [Xylaria longipes]RYC55085.1 hypothetical protein CHU98_g11123 [Xylaria longipes]
MHTTRRTRYKVEFVLLEEPMPEGYVYVPDSDWLIMLKCQYQTVFSGRVLYVVVQPYGRNIRRGIRVPKDVAGDVISNHPFEECDNPWHIAIQKSFTELVKTKPSEWFLELTWI